MSERQLSVLIGLLLMILGALLGILGKMPEYDKFVELCEAITVVGGLVILVDSLATKEKP